MEKKPLWINAAPLVAALVIWFVLSGFDPVQRTVGAIFALTVGLWVTEAVPLAVTALISSALLILLGGLKEKEVFAAYGDPTIPLFIGSFILAKSMEISGLGKRFALIILSRKGFTKSPALLLLALGGISCVISLFISNTATTAILLPIGLSMLAALGNDRKGSPYAISVMLMLTWGSSVAVGVPVGHSSQSHRHGYDRASDRHTHHLFAMDDVWDADHHSHAFCMLGSVMDALSQAGSRNGSCN